MPDPPEVTLPESAVKHPEPPTPSRIQHVALTPITPPRRLAAAHFPTWLVSTLQAHGPEVTLTALNAVAEYSSVATALRRHSHLLTPLDGETSMAAMLLARLSGDHASSQLKPGLKALLRRPYLKATSLPDLPESGLIQVFTGGEGGISALAADPGGRWLASQTGNGVLRVWDIMTGKAAHIFSRPEKTGLIGRSVLLTIFNCEGY